MHYEVPCQIAKEIFWSETSTKEGHNSQLELAEKFNLSPSRVSRILKETVLDIKESRNREIREKYKTGKFTQIELVQLYDLCHATISEITRDINLIEIRNCEIITKYKSGKYTQKQLAKEYGLHKSTTYLLLKDIDPKAVDE